jgi:hypothetical protein
VANTKSRKPIADADVSRIFDDGCIETLVAIGRLPVGTDRKRFAEGVRKAARIYARDARIPTDNKLHAEIAALYRAAERKRYTQAAALLEQVSLKACDLLNKRGARLGHGLGLPAPEELRDATRQQKACAAVLRLCQYGGRYVEGRRRLRASAQKHGAFSFMRRSLAAVSRSGTRSEILCCGLSSRGSRRPASRQAWQLMLKD